MVISCLGQTVFAFDTFIAVGSSCFWKSISWRSSMMTSQPISRFFKLKQCRLRNSLIWQGSFSDRVHKIIWTLEERNKLHELFCLQSASGNWNSIPFQMRYIAGILSLYYRQLYNSWNLSTVRVRLPTVHWLRRNIGLQCPHNASPSV